MSLHEVHDAASIIHEAAHEDAQVIFGAVTDNRLHNELCVTVIAGTGMHGPYGQRVVAARTRRVPTGRKNAVSAHTVPTKGACLLPVDPAGDMWTFPFMAPQTLITDQGNSQKVQLQPGVVVTEHFSLPGMTVGSQGDPLGERLKA